MRQVRDRSREWYADLEGSSVAEAVTADIGAHRHCRPVMDKLMAPNTGRSGQRCKILARAGTGAPRIRAPSL